MIPYGHQSINDEDVAEVVKVLRSGWLTQGPQVDKFEQALSEYCNTKYAVATSSGTSALHAAFFASGLKYGDEFITTPITFPATSNAGLWQGARPIFVDIQSKSGNLNVDLIEQSITKNTKAIVSVDYTGRPIELDKIKEIADKYNLLVIEDACQALGASYNGKKIGSLNDFTVFSFHPVKNITTCEGGAVLTNNKEYYKKMKKFVNHGITKFDLTTETPGDWYFEQQDLGLNYRLTDLQCALGVSQLKRLDSFVEKRRQLVASYNEAFEIIEEIITPPFDSENIKSAWHLYVIRLSGRAANQRGEIFKKLRDNGIGVQVHHIPVYYHPYYKSLGYSKGICPEAEKFYERIISLPLYPDLTAEHQNEVIEKVKLAVYD